MAVRLSGPSLEGKRFENVASDKARQRGQCVWVGAGLGDDDLDLTGQNRDDGAQMFARDLDEGVDERVESLGGGFWRGWRAGGEEGGGRGGAKEFEEKVDECMDVFWMCRGGWCRWVTERTRKGEESESEYLSHAWRVVEAKRCVVGGVLSLCLVRVKS